MDEPVGIHVGIVYIRMIFLRMMAWLCRGGLGCPDGTLLFDRYDRFPPLRRPAHLPEGTARKEIPLASLSVFSACILRV